MKKLLLTGLVLTMITSCNTTINSNNISSSSVNTTSSSSKVISSSQVQYKNALEEFNGNTSLDFDFLDYKENKDLDLMITQYVNENLEEIIHFAWDEIEASGDVERFSPLRLVAQSREECLLRIRELWQFSQDAVLHVDLSPVYQYRLPPICQ